MTPLAQPPFAMPLPFLPPKNSVNHFPGRLTPSPLHPVHPTLTPITDASCTLLPNTSRARDPSQMMPSTPSLLLPPPCNLHRNQLPIVNNKKPLPAKPRFSSLTPPPPPTSFATATHAVSQNTPSVPWNYCHPSPPVPREPHHLKELATFTQHHQPGPITQHHQPAPITSPSNSSPRTSLYNHQPTHNPNNPGISQLPNLSSPLQRLQPATMAKTKTKRNRAKRRQTPPRAPTPPIPSSKASATTTTTTTAPSSSQESHGIGAQPDSLRADPSAAAASESTSSNSSSSSSSSSSTSTSFHDSKPTANTPAVTTKDATQAATTKAPQKKSPTTAKHASTPTEVSTGPHPANASFASGLSSNPFSALADDSMSVASDDATPTEVNILQGWSPANPPAPITELLLCHPFTATITNRLLTNHQYGNRSAVIHRRINPTTLTRRPMGDAPTLTDRLHLS
ncbi:hypothetical protein SEMRO_74_G040590.1 [Seminavis robusta]|uniref:Uncharacterized protein n=1 Tax=Seminavis robusta TaxID=568900 RepID=A0A9N8DDJ6_9STRA|nr:hypothetical protein SEMRO_74_G040590.1 [Seminavis robusta]|eukprot:Sro74_g040590.1 n/a (454) ;mRNA; r:14-1375